MKVYVLRIGHRPERDKRITTHVGLTARAFGASGFILSPCDEKIIEKIKDVEKRWGKLLEMVDCTNSPISYIKKWKERGVVVHLTMYGININDVINNIKDISKDVLVIVGAEKVPREYYELADFNIAIGNQPHSEVAALAVFLDRLFEGRELEREPKNPQLKILPTPKGKRVISFEH